MTRNTTTFKMLRSAGFSVADANNFVEELNKRTAGTRRTSKISDWEGLINPVVRQIATLASSQCKWGKHPARAEVYAPYLALLRKTRDKIREGQALSKGKTIPEYVRAYNDTKPRDNTNAHIRLEGLRWDGWVPLNVREAFIKAFDVMYTKQEGGKRLVPFSTAGERTASDVRWDRLEATLIMEREARKAMVGCEYMLPFIESAIQVLTSRDLTDVAPVHWEHLLTAVQRKELTDLGIAQAARRMARTEATLPARWAPDTDTDTTWDAATPADQS